MMREEDTKTHNPFKILKDLKVYKFGYICYYIEVDIYGIQNFVEI